MSGFCVATSIASNGQTFTVLANFDGSNGSGPQAPLIQTTDGNFYGATSFGGSGIGSCGGETGCGTIFKMTPSGSLTVLYSFCMQDGCPDGSSPNGALVQGADGNFYGTTFQGGISAGGTVFKITPSGALTTLYQFDGLDNGEYPTGGLVRANDGNFYGTTGQGGISGGGTVFKITSSGVLTTLHSFSNFDGGMPEPLVQASDGDLYGTTKSGGDNSDGTAFKITLSGTLTTLHNFNGDDGSLPEAALVQGIDGNFYGTTYEGGNGYGTVFQMTPTGVVTVLHSFAWYPADGAYPTAALLQATDHNFYGTTSQGGADDAGTVFKITPQGTLTILHSFALIDGASPSGSLIQSSDSSFYGTAFGGGINGSCDGTGCGTVFRLSPSTPTPLQFIPATPCRVVDTRNPEGTFGGPTMQGNSVRDFPLSENDNPCGIPANAMAYSLNVTVVPLDHLRYLTIWPTGDGLPAVSTMNSPDGRTKANAAIVPAGLSGSVSVYVTDTTDVILDIDGYFIAPTQGSLQFYPLVPCRVIDTRSGSNQPQGLGPPSFSALESREMPVLSKSPCLQNLPNQPQAYSLNVTVSPTPAGQPLSYLTVWPSDEPQPTVSTLNNPKALLVANAAIVPAASNGDISIYTRNSTDVIVDINGYFAAAGENGVSFYSLAPCRAYDSRNNNGQPFSGERTVDIVDSPCSPPGNAQGYVFNATVVPSGPLGYLTLWPDNEQQPVVSTLNSSDGAVTSNMAIVPNINGKTDAWAQGVTQLILDLAGYFAP